MKTIVVKMDLDEATAIVQDNGNLSWERTLEVMKALAQEFQFFHKRATKPKAVRIGNVRVILAGFYDTREGIEPSRDDPSEDDHA